MTVRDKWKREKPWMTKEIIIPYRSKADEERLGRLFRRIEHLEARIRGRDYNGEDASFDRMEISALKYALNEIAMSRALPERREK